MQKLMNIKGKVIGIDINLKKNNENKLKKHQFIKIELFY